MNYETRRRQGFCGTLRKPTGEHRDFLAKKYPCSAKALPRKEFRNSK